VGVTKAEARAPVGTRHEWATTVAALRERKRYREAIMKLWYEATEGNRLLDRHRGEYCATPALV
jgi:hypothetical protein